MDVSFWILVGAVGAFFYNRYDQARRVLLLRAQLQPYQLEQLMQTLLEGYLRAQGEADEERRRSIWQVMEGHEALLVSQLQRLASDTASLTGPMARVSRLPLLLPGVTAWWPKACFELGQAFRIHAEGVTRVAHNPDGLSPRDKAFCMTAELLLFQHTCHWYCRSRTTASTRLVARHQTSHAQALAAASAATREGLMAIGAV
ncbi:hypothetical protein [Hydrogenophaga sp. R2]|uniref:hypothetical protein n=1 Tax=Hydrogenophaga sp. R2 TaxID=3132827 RepID=UPI003CF8611F